MDIDVPGTERADEVTDRWVALAAGQRAYGSHVRPTANRTRIRESVLRHVVTDSLFVAEEDGDLLGFVMFTIEDGSYEQDVTRGLVENLFVTPDARGEGVGSALLAAAESALVDRGADVVALEVLADNDDARRFYRREGYDPHRVELEKAVENDTHTRDDE